MGKFKQKKEDMTEIELFYTEKENRRKKREINKQKKDKRNKKDKWN